MDAQERLATEYIKAIITAGKKDHEEILQHCQGTINLGQSRLKELIAIADKELAAG